MALLFPAVASFAEDEAWPGCFEARQVELLAHLSERFSQSEGYKHPFIDLCVLEHGVKPTGKGIEIALHRMDKRLDCADFNLPGILTLLYTYQDHPQVDPAWLERSKQSLLGFKYWFDEPGADEMCMWTENHQILFNAGAYLAGQLYPDELFTSSGKTGRALMAFHKPLIERWLDFRNGI